MGTCCAQLPNTNQQTQTQLTTLSDYEFERMNKHNSKRITKVIDELRQNQQTQTQPITYHETEYKMALNINRLCDYEFERMNQYNSKRIATYKQHVEIGHENVDNDSFGELNITDLYDDDILPDGWIMLYTEAGVAYYYNETAGCTQWEKPFDKQLLNDQIAGKMNNVIQNRMPTPTTNQIEDDDIMGFYDALDLNDNDSMEPYESNTKSITDSNNNEPVVENTPYLLYIHGNGTPVEQEHQNDIIQDANNGLSWNNASKALEHELYPRISKAVETIIDDQQNDINQLTGDSIQKVLNIIRDKKQFITKEQLSIIKETFTRLENFKPMSEDKWWKLTIPTKRFCYKYDFDKNGLLYFLGCKGNIKVMNSPYLNPVKSNMVVVTSSPLITGLQSLDKLFDRYVFADCATINTNGSFISWGLGTVSIKLSHYTLGNSNYNILRNWNLEGSNDGKTWIIIKYHCNDHSLKLSGDTCTWQVNCDKYFSYFRLKITGVNNSCNYHLSCSGVELYGDLIGKKKNYQK
eukprot:18077_1